MKKTEVLLSLTSFDFVTDDGEHIKGANVYVLGGNVQTDNIKGHRVAKHFIDSDLAQKVVALPCKAETTYEVDIKGDGSTGLKLVDVKYLKDVKLNDL